MFRKEHGKVNVTSLVECVIRNEDRQSKPIMEALIQGLAPLPADARQSVTFDRGTEFSAWKHLKAGIGADTFAIDLEHMATQWLTLGSVQSVAERHGR